MKLCVTEPDFLEKNFLSQNLGKWTKNRPKTGFFEFIEKFALKFSLDLLYNENLYYLLCSCTDPLFGKIFVPGIWSKMFSANQIIGFFNQTYLQNKSVKEPDFLHVDTYSHELKVYQKILGWAWSKMGVTTLVMGL